MGSILVALDCIALHFITSHCIALHCEVDGQYVSWSQSAKPPPVIAISASHLVLVPFKSWSWSWWCLSHNHWYTLLNWLSCLLFISDCDYWSGTLSNVSSRRQLDIIFCSLHLILSVMVWDTLRCNHGGLECLVIMFEHRQIEMHLSKVAQQVTPVRPRHNLY